MEFVKPSRGSEKDIVIASLLSYHTLFYLLYQYILFVFYFCTEYEMEEIMRPFSANNNTKSKMTYLSKPSVKLFPAMLRFIENISRAGPLISFQLKVILFLHQNYLYNH